MDAGAGTQPNAWQVADVSISGGVLAFTKTLTAEQKTAATNNGWHYTIVSRLVAGSPNNTPAQYMVHGNGTRRFFVAWDANASGQLVAIFNGTNYVPALTAVGQATNAYHTHELTYDPATLKATYRFDGVTILTWGGVAPDANQNGVVQWGSGNSAGRGTMNYHDVRFAISGLGMISQYSAGTAGWPAVAPSPTNQGWNIILPAPLNAVTNAPVSPDAVTLPGFDLEYDQRGPGFSRNANFRIDIGAYEVQPPEASQVTITAQGVCVSLKGEPNEPLTIESNSDLSPDGWDPLVVSTTDAKGKGEVVDSAPLSKKRFYRVIRK